MSRKSAYDPNAVEDRKSSSYMSAKDIRNLLLVFVALGVIMIPIYGHFKKQSDQHVCKQNFAQMSKGMQLYLEANNNRFPPVFYADSAESDPIAINGSAISWMTLIRDGMESRSNYRCPSASEAELAHSIHPSEADKPMETAYGMYLPWSTWSAAMVQRPELSVLIAETSNRGAANTFNPVSFGSGDDGFAIGWDDDPFQVTSKSQWVTRLAFPDTKSGEFKKTGPTRHNNGIHALAVDGSLITLKPDNAKLSRVGRGEGSQISGSWATY